MTVYVYTPLGKRDIDSLSVLIDPDKDFICKAFNEDVAERFDAKDPDTGEPIEYIENEGGIYVVELPHADSEQAVLDAVDGDLVRLNLELWKALPQWSEFLEPLCFPSEFFPEDHPYWEDDTIGEPLDIFKDASIVCSWKPDIPETEYVDYQELYAEQGGEVTLVTDEMIAEVFDYSGNNKEKD